MAGGIPATSSRALGKLLTRLQAMSIDPAPLCAGIGFDPALCEDVDARVPMSQLFDLWEAIQRRLGRADAALVLARQAVPSDYHLIGFGAINSTTLGDALGHLARYLRLWTDEPSLAIDEPGVVRLSYRAQLPDRPGKRCVTEGALAEIVHVARLVTRREFGASEICLAHAGPADRAAYEAYFEAPVRFDQPRAEIRFSPAMLALPLPEADPRLGQLMRELASEALSRLPRIDSLFDQLRVLIAEELHKGVPTMEELAARLATSPRTLRRRLLDEKTSYRALLDETRAALARDYVCKRRLPLSEVAFMLGFSEASAFHRAFKRWTGVPPLKYRETANSDGR